MDCLQLLEKNYWTKEGLPNSYCDSCFLFHSIFLSDLSISLSRPLFIFINIFLSFSNTIYIFVYPSFSLSLSLSHSPSLFLFLSLSLTIFPYAHISPRSLIRLLMQQQRWVGPRPKYLRWLPPRLMLMLSLRNIDFHLTLKVMQRYYPKDILMEAISLQSDALVII